MFNTVVIRSDQSVADRKEKIGNALQRPFTLVFGTRTIEKFSDSKFQNNMKVKQIHLLFRILLAPFAIIFSPILLPMTFVGKHLIKHSSSYRKAMALWNTFLRIQFNKVDIPLVSGKDFKEKKITEKQVLEKSYLKPQALAEHDLKAFPKNKLDMNFGFRRFFGKVFVINAPSKEGVKRWKLFNKNMKKIDLKEGQDYQRYPGVDANTIPRAYVDRFDKTSKTAVARRAGAMACFLAQLNVLKHANQKLERAKQSLRKGFEAIKDATSISEQQLNKIKEAQRKIRKYSVMFVLEDNAAWGRLINDGKDVSIKGEGYRWRKMLAGLPSDWDYINLWPTTIPGTKEYKEVNPYLLKCDGATATKGIIFNHTAYPKIINKLESILNNPSKETEHVDQIYRKMQKKKELTVYTPHKSFIFRELVDSLVGCKYNKRLQLDCV